MYKTLALINGVMVAIMVTLNGILAKSIGDYGALLLIHIVAFAAVGLMIIARKEKMQSLKHIPVYLFLGGVIGVFNVFSNNLCINALGVTVTLATCLFGQTIMACFVDHFGWFHMDRHRFNRKKLVGFFLVATGIVVMSIY